MRHEDERLSLIFWIQLICVHIIHVNISVQTKTQRIQSLCKRRHRWRQSSTSLQQISFQCPEWGGAGWYKRVSIKLQQLFQALSGLNVVTRSSPKPYVMVSRTLIRIRRLCIVYTLRPSWSCGFIHDIAVTLLYSTHRYIYVHYNLHVSCQVALLTVMIFFYSICRPTREEDYRMNQNSTCLSTCSQI